MKPEIIFIGVLMAVIAAGPYRYAMLAGIGLAATVVSAMLTSTLPVDVFGMAVLGGIVFAGRGLLRALTGYGALIRFTPPDDNGNGDNDGPRHWRNRNNVDAADPADGGEQMHWRDQNDVDAPDRGLEPDLATDGILDQER